MNAGIREIHALYFVLLAEWNDRVCGWIFKYKFSASSQGTGNFHRAGNTAFQRVSD